MAAQVPAPPRPPPAPPAAPAQTPRAQRACAALAVIGKKNRPLAFRVYDANSDAYLRNLVLCSLDVVDECAQAQENGRDEFLGAATTVDGRKLHASRTATGITLCAVLDAGAGVPEAHVRACLADARKAYAKCLANPFFKLDGGEITSSVFAARVDEAVRLRLESAAVVRAPPSQRPTPPPTPPR